MSKLTKVLKNIRNNQGIHEKLFTARELREKVNQVAGEATRRNKQNGEQPAQDCQAKISLVRIKEKFKKHRATVEGNGNALLPNMVIRNQRQDRQWKRKKGVANHYDRGGM